MLKAKTPAFWIGVALLVLSVILALLDWLKDWPELWSQHSMFTEVIAGLLLLGVTVFCIDTVVRHREDQRRTAELEARWHGLGGIGFRALGNAIGDLVDGMAWLLSAAHPLERPPALTAEHAYRLEVLITQANLPLVCTEDTGDFTAQLFKQRLNRLLAEEEWCRFAHDCLDLLKWRFRDRIGGWASPMLELSDLALILARAGLVDECVNQLQAALRPLAGWAGHPSKQQAERRWFEALAEAVCFREDLQRAAVVESPMTFEEGIARLQDWAKFRHWLNEDNYREVTKRADAAQETEQEWKRRARQAVQTALAGNDALLEGWRRNSSSPSQASS